MGILEKEWDNYKDHMYASPKELPSKEIIDILQFIFFSGAMAAINNIAQRVDNTEELTKTLNSMVSELKEYKDTL